MKKLHIDKIKLSDMSTNEQESVQGGAQVGPTGTVITILVISETMTIIQGCYSFQCHSKNPGTADSCGLCTTHQRC